MPKKLSYNDIKDYINREDELISGEYKNNKQLLDIKCSKCNNIYKQNFDRYKRGYRHQECPIKKDKKTNIPKRNCDECKLKYQPCRNNTKFCNIKCYYKYMATDQEYKDKCKLYGKKGGMISLKTQKNRSKNEILFSKYCKKFYGKKDVKCNIPMFNGYDTDVLIVSKKIAIEWNGIWHYKKIHENHNLLRIQAKDKYKEKIIPSFGYELYVIKDMKSYNEKFVKKQFDKFIDYMSYKEAYYSCTEFL